MKQPRGYVCPPAHDPIELDGLGSDPAWNRAPSIDYWPDIRGEEYGQSPLPIKAQMLWSAEYLYLHARMAEPDLWAFETQHDGDLWHDNVFELFLDPDGDGWNYFEWEVNPLGVTLDMSMDRPYVCGGRRDNSLEIPGLKLALVTDGPVNDPSSKATFWSFEAAFPWNCLAPLGHGAPRPRDCWRFNLMKMFYPVEVRDGAYQKTAEEERYWTFAPTGIMDIHRPYFWGYLEFAEDSSHAPQIDPDWPTKFELVRALGLHQRPRNQTSLDALDVRLSRGQQLIDHPSGFAIRAAGESGAVYTISADGQLGSANCLSRFALLEI